MAVAGAHAGQHGHCQTRRFTSFCAVRALIQPAVWFVDHIAEVLLVAYISWEDGSEVSRGQADTPLLLRCVAEFIGAFLPFFTVGSHLGVSLVSHSAHE